MTYLIQLLIQAHETGLVLQRQQERLIIRGDPSAAAISRELLARKHQVFQLLPLYQGALTGLDWSRGETGEPAACILCGKPALCREPWEHQPCHKVCAEAQLLPSALPG
jgi:hypothetical protein